MQMLVSLIAGLVFGLGLILAGMTDSAKVQAFLDLLGRDRKSTRLNSSHSDRSRMPSSA